MAIIVQNDRVEVYRSHAEIVAGIIEEIRLREPLWATEPGTPLRKLIDAFAAMLEQITLDAYVAQISWDLESKSGTELDEFVAMFGFERKQATKATGLVKFFAEDPGGAPQRFSIPAGSRVTTAPASGGTVLGFVTTDTVILEQGAFSVEAPVEAEAAGSIYNVEANTIVIEASGLPGVGGDSPIRNENATTGGSDIESDAALRARFRRTLFRNIAGTREAYIGVADRHEAVTSNRVAVYSQSERREDIIQFSDVDQNGDPWPSNEVRAYLPRTDLYFESELLSPIDDTVIPEDRDFYTRYTDYVVLTDLTGSYLQALSGGSIEAGQTCVVSYEYKSPASRADEFGNTRNVVDIYVGGSVRTTGTDLATMDYGSVFNAEGRLLNAMTASQTEIELMELADNFPVTGVVMIDDGVIEYIKYTGKTLNKLTGCIRGTDVNGNPGGSIPATHAALLEVVDVTDRYFTKLMFQPVEELSDTIVQGDKVFREGIDYQLVKDPNNLGNAGSWRGRDGIAWERLAVSPAQNEIQTISPILANCIQELSRTSTVNGGQYILSHNGNDTVPLNHNAGIATIESALEALPSIGAGNVNVTGGPLPNTPVLIEFLNALANTEQDLLEVDSSNLSGTGVYKTEYVQEGHGVATAGTWDIEFDGETTSTFDWNESNATIQAELEALPGIGTGNVQVTGGPLPSAAIQVQFINGLAQQALPVMVLNQSLSGGEFEVLEVQDGHGPYPDAPDDDTQFRVDYVWDTLPKILYDQYYTAPVRNITADVLVHTGKEVYFGINLAIMYNGQLPISQVNAEIEALLTAYVEQLGFGATIQLHDFIDIAYNSRGVDNVRFVRPNEHARDFFIRLFGQDGNSTIYQGRTNFTNDFTLRDDEIPVLQEVNFTRKAQNTW